MADAPGFGLSLKWAFGFNSASPGGVVNLSTKDSSAIFYASAHTGIIHDLDSGTQRVLQGHANAISAVAASRDRKWIATADAGDDDSLLVVWSVASGTPVKTIVNPHAGGVAAMDISPDSKFLATVRRLSCCCCRLPSWAAAAAGQAAAAAAAAAAASAGAAAAPPLRPPLLFRALLLATSCLRC